MEKLLVLIGAVGLLAGVSLLFAWPVMLLWNSCLVPAVAGVSQIGFWQCVGLLLLSSAFFKSTK